MAKLYFRYGAMNSGKSTLLLQVAYNYEENGKKILVLKPCVDTKGDSHIVSRLGIRRKVDILIGANDDVLELLSKQNHLDCVLVDEVQFLKKEQIEQLWVFAGTKRVPVICYGLRLDFKAEGFPGSTRLLELADQIEEIPTICSCTKKARFAGRKVNGVYTTKGPQVVIDGADDVVYESLCSLCYLTKVKNGNK